MNRLLAFFKKNYRSLSGSFLLAFLLWFAVTTDKEYTTKISIPISIDKLGQGLVLKNVPPTSVQLEIKGSGRSLFGLNFLDNKIALDLPEITSSGEINLNDYKNRFHFPSELGIEVVDIVYPKKIKIEVDRFDKKVVPVKINSDVKTQAGYILVGQSANIDSIEISGPKSFVEKMSFVETDTISRDNIRFPFSTPANMYNPHPGVLTINPSHINVNINVEQLVERTIYNIPIRVTHLPEDLEAEATPPSISLRIKGGETVISKVDSDEIKVVFNYAAHYKRGQSDYPMEIETPVDVTWIEASPKVFTLKLIRKDEKNDNTGN